jgi:dihydropyrimidinase
MKADNNIFEGMTVHGKPRYVLSRGRKVADDGAFVGASGNGIHQRSSPFRPVQL